MTTTCTHCGGPSRVVLTRTVVGLQLWSSGDAPRRRGGSTVARTRQCRDCRYKWKTIERAMPARLPKGWRILQ